jgi:exosortase
MIFLPLLGVLALCWRSVLALHQQWVDWQDTTHTHGYLIVAITLWMLWRDRREIRVVADSPRVGNLWLFLAMACAWLLLEQAGIQSLEFALLPMLLWIAVLTCSGGAVARRCAFPIAFLYFATPVWGAFNGILQWSTVFAVRVLLRLVDVPAFFDANRVHIPSGTFEIAGGCSGLHFTVVGLACAALLGELRADSWRRRLTLLALAAMFAVATNWVRVFTIVLAGHVTHMQHYLVTQSHYFFGWLVFAVAMFAFLVLERRIPLMSRVFAPQVPVKSSSDNAASGRWRASHATVVTIMIIALMSLWHMLAARPAAAHMIQMSPPPGWKGPEPVTDDWHPRFVGVDEEKQAVFRNDEGALVTAYLGFYRNQHQGKEFSGYTNDIRGNARDPEWLISARYRVGERGFRNPTVAQLWYAVQALTRLRSPPSQVLVLRVACRPDCNAGAHWLNPFEE